MKQLFAVLTLLGIWLNLNAQGEWPVPEDKEKQLSPFAFTDESVAAGKMLYDANCMSCHGTPGQGDYITLDPSPGDMATQKIQRNSDGAIFYKVLEGRGAMPSFKNILSSSDIWNIVAYIRSFNPDYAQEVAKKIIEGTFGASDLKILLEFLQDKNQIQAVVVGKKDGEPIPVPNAEVSLFARRKFGNLPVDETKRTNESGLAFFEAPTDLPGDTFGNLDFFARLPNETLYGTVETDTTIQAGLPTTPVSLRAQRAMWNTVWRAPVWLLIAYFTTVVVIWGFIFFIVLQIRKIFLLGKDSQP